MGNYQSYKNPTKELSATPERAATPERSYGLNDGDLYLAALESNKMGGIEKLQQLLSTGVDVNRKLKFPIRVEEYENSGGGMFGISFDSPAPDYTKKYKKMTLTSGETPLHAAAKVGNPNAVKLLLSHKASLSDYNIFDETPLFDAVASKYSKCAECAGLLLEAKANLHKKTDYSYALGWEAPEETTPLKMALNSKTGALFLLIFPFVKDRFTHINRRDLKYLSLLSELRADSPAHEPILIRVRCNPINPALFQEIQAINALSFFSVVSIDLSRGQITDEVINVSLLKCLVYLQALQLLRLSYNYITYTGLYELADTLKEHPTIQTIDLSDNRIVCAPEWLSKLGDTLGTCPSLDQVLIDNNFFDEECEKKLLLPGPTQGSTSSFRYGVFSSQIKPSKSLLDPSSELTPKNWVVSLACKKGTEHSMLFLEGMRKSGQKFLERYHIKAIALKGKAAICIERPTLNFFDSNDYHQVLHNITHTKGEILKDYIKDDATKSTGIDFSKFTPKLTGNDNCLTWCRTKLGLIGIHIETDPFGRPSATSQKPSIQGP